MAVGEYRKQNAKYLENKVKLLKEKARYGWGNIDKNTVIGNEDFKRLVNEMPNNPIINTQSTSNQPLPKSSPTSASNSSASKAKPKSEKGKVLKKAVGWVKKHPKTSIGTGAGLAILGTGGYLGYQHLKNKKSK